MNPTLGKLMEWMKWPAIVVGFAVATNGIATFFGYERTTAEQRLEVYKAEQKGYHAARDSAQRLRDSAQDLRDSVLIAQMVELDEHQEDALIGECTENLQADLIHTRRVRLISWCVKHQIPFKQEAP